MGGIYPHSILYSIMRVLYFHETSETWKCLCIQPTRVHTSTFVKVLPKKQWLREYHFWYHWNGASNPARNYTSLENWTTVGPMSEDRPGQPLEAGSRFPGLFYYQYDSKPNPVYETYETPMNGAKSKFVQVSEA